MSDVVNLTTPTRWPAMKVGEHEFPRSLDKHAPSHPARPRTGNYNGRTKKRNKGGKRVECSHGTTGHGPCSCNK